MCSLNFHWNFLQLIAPRVIPLPLLFIRFNDIEYLIDYANFNNHCPIVFTRLDRLPSKPKSYRKISKVKVVGIESATSWLTTQTVSHSI